MENRNGSRAPNIYLLSWAFITGRNIGRILCEPLGHMQINICEAKDLMITRITLDMKKKKKISIDKTFRALKMVAWLFSAHHLDIAK